MNKILLISIIAIISFFTYGVFTNQNKTSIKKEKRVACQKETVTFEKIENNHLIDDAIKLLKSNNYQINSRIEKAIYMKSKISDFITIEKADLILKDIIKKHFDTKLISEKKLLIDYYILENDREDKGKKGTDCKLYAGYLVFEFILDGKLVYKIQTDYMKDDTSDIPSRMECVIKSFISLHH